jgi:hypothetical protein
MKSESLHGLAVGSAERPVTASPHSTVYPNPTRIYVHRYIRTDRVFCASCNVDLGPAKNNIEANDLVEKHEGLRR